MFAILIGIFAGICIGLQTAVNARLHSFLNAPFLTAFISFAVGAITLFSLLLLTGQPLLYSTETLSTIPTWAWFGGVLGMIGLTGNVLLFPKLGGVQTAVMPILGQVLMSVLIDSFGWFNSPQVNFTLHRLIGICLVLAGVFIAVVLPNIRILRAKQENGLWGWRLVGILVGTMMSLQTAINGELGRQVGSATYAAMISMIGGMSSISLIVLSIERSFTRLPQAIGKGKPIWIWLGGVLGAFYISVGAWLMQYVGTGGTVVLMLCGLITASLMIDKWGWFGAPKKAVHKIQLVGLLLLIAGVSYIRLF